MPSSSNLIELTNGTSLRWPGALFLLSLHLPAGRRHKTNSESHGRAMVTAPPMAKTISSTHSLPTTATTAMFMAHSGRMDKCISSAVHSHTCGSRQSLVVHAAWQPCRYTSTVSSVAGPCPHTVRSSCLTTMRQRRQRPVRALPHTFCTSFPHVHGCVTFAITAAHSCCCIASIASHVLGTLDRPVCNASFRLPHSQRLRIPLRAIRPLDAALAYLFPSLAPHGCHEVLRTYTMRCFFA